MSPRPRPEALRPEAARPDALRSEAARPEVPRPEVSPRPEALPAAALRPEALPAAALRPEALPRDTGDPDRYGVYLRPDPRTCLAVTTATAQLRAQYGFVSAGAFPPHATLVGSEPLGRDEDAIAAAVGAALAGVTAFPVHNSGIRPLGAGFVYDVHHLADGATPNTALTDLAARIDAAVTPLRRPVASPASHRFDAGSFQAHLSLASHDLVERPDLHDEVGELLRDLDLPHPATFPGRVVTLYRTTSPDWTGRWWRTMGFTHLRSWTLPAPA